MLSLPATHGGCGVDRTGRAEESVVCLEDSRRLRTVYGTAPHDDGESLPNRPGLAAKAMLTSLLFSLIYEERTEKAGKSERKIRISIFSRCVGDIE